MEEVWVHSPASYRSAVKQKDRLTGLPRSLRFAQTALNMISKIQEVFGSDKAGDDPLWDDTLVLEPKPTVPGSYRLSEGFYTIIEKYAGFNFRNIVYQNNALYKRETTDEIDTNYLIFALGKSPGS